MIMNGILEHVRPVIIETPSVDKGKHLSIPVGHVLCFSNGIYKVYIRDGIEQQVGSQREVDIIARYYHSKVGWDLTQVPRN